MKFRHIFILIAILIHFGAFAQVAPDFNVVDSEGQTHNLYADYLDQGTTMVIKLFFVNCPPCNNIAPFFQDLYEAWGEGQEDVQFIEMTILASDNDADVNNYKAQLGLTFPGISADGGSLVAVQPYRNGMFGPYYGTPTFVVIAPDGTVNQGVTGAGISGTIDAIDMAIAATGATGGTTVIPPTQFSFNFNDAFGNPVGLDAVTVTSTEPGAPSYQASLATAISYNTDEFNTAFPSLQTPVFRFAKTDEAALRVSAIDILIVLRHILGIELIQNPDLLIAANANGDQSISAIDLVTMQKIILGIEDAFPNSDPWIFQPAEIPVSFDPGNIQTFDVQVTKLGDLNGF